MKIAHDFLDNWKVSGFALLLDDDKLAPLYIIRLWSYTERQRAYVLELDPAKLAMICRFRGDPQTLWTAMLNAECGWLVKSGKKFEVRGWAEQNKQLIHLWKRNCAKPAPKKRPAKAKDGASAPTTAPSAEREAYATLCETGLCTVKYEDLATAARGYGMKLAVIGPELLARLRNEPPSSLESKGVFTILKWEMAAIQKRQASRGSKKPDVTPHTQSTREDFEL